jgi:hypothetical protein
MSAARSSAQESSASRSRLHRTKHAVGGRAGLCRFPSSYNEACTRGPCPRRVRASQNPACLDMTDDAHPSVREYSEVRTTTARDTRHARRWVLRVLGAVPTATRPKATPRAHPEQRSMHAPVERRSCLRGAHRHPDYSGYSVPGCFLPPALREYSPGTHTVLRALGTRGVLARHWATAAVLTRHRVLRPTVSPRRRAARRLGRRTGDLAHRL